MNLIKMQIPTGYSVDLFLLFSWFGDYRSLRFLCVYFGRRTFYFVEGFMKKFLVSILSIILVSSSFNLIACGNNPNKYLGHRHNGLYNGDFCEECGAICWDSEEGYVVMELEYNLVFKDITDLLPTVQIYKMIENSL